MSNPYDQFYSLPATAAEPNPYDQFDPPTAAAGNIYDQFDTAAPETLPASRRFSPEQYQAFASLGGLGPAMAAGSLPLEIAATDSAKIDHSGGPGYFVMPASYGRPPQEGEPLAPVIAPEDLPQPPGPPSAIVTVLKPPGPPSAIVTVPRSFIQPPAVVKVSKPPGPPSATVTVPRFTGKPSAVVTVPQPTGRLSAVISVPKDSGGLPSTVPESEPASSPPTSQPWDERVGRTINNGFNSVMRGAVSEGYQQAAEGFYNILGTLLGRNPHSNTPTQDLRIQLRIAEQHLAVENAAIKERLKRQPRGFAPPPDYSKLKDSINSIRDELNYRQDNGESFVHAARSFLESTQAEAASQRRASRDYFHVDKEFAESAAGKILQGVGGLTTLPLYGVPVLGPSTTISQVYQQGFDDYVQSREEQGKPVDWEEADRAAKTYLITAGPAEVLLDKLIVGKLLKGAVGKSTVGELRRRLGIIVVAGGFTNASQQAWLNVIAKELQGYDPERPFTKGVLESVFYGGLFSGIGGSAGHYLTHDTTPVRKFDPEKRDRRGERGMAIVPWDNPKLGRSQTPDDRAGASPSAPKTNESDSTNPSPKTPRQTSNPYPGPLKIRPMKGLTPEQAEVEAQFARWIQEDLDRATSMYAEIRETENGRVIDVDEARKLSVDYDFNKQTRTRHTLSVNSVAGNFVAKVLLPNALEKLQSGDVLGLTAGGPGSGKGTIKELLPREWHDAKFVYDGVLRRFDRATDLIELARESGAKTTIWYVHAPIEQAVVQAMRRAETWGRVVPLDVLAKSHFDAQQTIVQLLKRYDNDPSVEIRVIDNSNPTPQIVQNPLDFLGNESIKYKNEELTETRARSAFRANIRELSNPESRLIFQGGPDRPHAGGRVE